MAARVEGREARLRRRLAPGQVPDPLRAHGAWVYLAVSVLAGTFAAGARSPAPGLSAGGLFVGLFVLAASVAARGRGCVRPRAMVGLLLTLGSLLLTLHLSADRTFLLFALLAIPPGAAAAYSGARWGFLSPSALSFGVIPLANAAPVSALAAGATLRSAALLLMLLVPFFVWRTWRLARALGPGWTRKRFARRGLLESLLATGWGAVAVTATRTLL